MSQLVSERTERRLAPPDGLLQRHWIHSREESTRRLEVYRPEGFAFPPAFGREGFEMRPNGAFIQDVVGPADGIIQVRGRWQLRSRRVIEVDFRERGGDGAPSDFAFRIVSLSADVLVIRRLLPGDEGGDSHDGSYDVDEQRWQDYCAQPAPSSVRLLDFEDADVVTLESFPPQHVLRVSGTKPYANMDLELVPLVYVRQPEHWEIEVVGTLRGIGLPALAPYAVSLPLNGSMGSVGIEVVGASRRLKIDLVEAPNAS